MIRKLALLLIVLLTVWLISHSVNRTVEESKSTHVREWTTEDSRAYAKDVVQVWANNQYQCLAKLWGKESAWNHEAYNEVKVMGKNAGGIPQILGMSTQTPAPVQIDRGFAYIMHRYGTPCTAWKFHKKKGWY